MPYFRRKGKAKAKPYTKKPKKATGRGGIKGLVTQLVKVQLHKQVEDKMSHLVYNLANFNSSATSAADCLQVLPDVAQGVGENQRIGNYKLN